MASVNYDKARSGYRVQLYTHTGRRIMIWLGSIKQSQARTIAKHLDEIKQCRTLGLQPEGKSKLWLDSVGERIRNRLIEYDLIDTPKPNQIPTDLQGYLDRYLEENSNLAARTLTNRKGSANHLTKFFGKDRPMPSITPGDVDRFSRHLYGTFLASSAGTICSHAKLFFKSALRDKVIDSNPFEDVRISKQSDQSRREYIPRETIDKLLDKCPNQLWRTIIVARYAGLAVPSEILSMRWSLCDWGGERFTVHKAKNIHHHNYVRIVPMFPDVRTELSKLHDEAKDGDDWVCTRYRTGGSSPFRDQLIKICADASVVPWPKLWMNFRASCRTDLEHVYPSYMCDAWLGHSKKVADKHYLMLTDADYAAAARGVACGVIEKSGGVAGGVVQKPQPTTSDSAE